VLPVARHLTPTIVAGAFVVLALGDSGNFWNTNGATVSSAVRVLRSHENDAISTGGCTLDTT
jgi:hypothetical protein